MFAIRQIKPVSCHSVMCLRHMMSMHHIGLNKVKAIWEHIMGKHANPQGTLEGPVKYA